MVLLGPSAVDWAQQLPAVLPEDLRPEPVSSPARRWPIAFSTESIRARHLLP